MNRDDIIRMAFEASDGVLSYDAEGRWILSEQEVIRLVASVAAAEREACAEVCESLASDDDDLPLEIEASSAGIIRDFVLYLAKTAIRARGEK